MKRTATGTYETTTIAGEMVKAFVPAPLPPSPPLEIDGAVRSAFGSRRRCSNCAAPARPRREGSRTSGAPRPQGGLCCNSSKRVSPDACLHDSPSLEADRSNIADDRQGTRRAGGKKNGERNHGQETKPRVSLR